MNHGALLAVLCAWESKKRKSLRRNYALRVTSIADAIILCSGQGIHVVDRRIEVHATALNEIEERCAIPERAIARGLSTYGEAEGEQGKSKRGNEVHFGLSFR